MKRLAIPILSGSGESVLRQYEHALREQEDLASLVNVSPHDLRHCLGRHERE
jgi:hypothetical protein